jgi:hypothetical protein
VLFIRKQRGSHDVISEDINESDVAFLDMAFVGTTIGLKVSVMCDSWHHNRAKCQCDV